MDIDAPRLFEPPPKAFLSLSDRFGVPPFSTLEARSGWWQERKQAWINLGIESEVGRDATPGTTPAARGQGGMVGQILRSSEGRDANLLSMSDQSRDAGFYARLRAWEAAEEQRRLIAESRGEEFVPGESPEPDPAKAIGGLNSGAGRGSKLALTGGRQTHAIHYYERLKAWQEAERLRREVAEAAGQEFVASEPPEPDPSDRPDGLLDSGAGRGDRLLSNATPRSGFGGDYDLEKGENAWGGSGTSIFDPVLCELAYRWFSPPGGAVLDPFAGGSVRGIVAAHLGRAYLGVDLRAEQCAANEQQRAAICGGIPEAAQPKWVCGDSRGLPILAPGPYDFVFSCPPYYDLERYSDDPADLSNAKTYLEFKHALMEIVHYAVEALADDRFACFVVGEVRGKNGMYLGLVPDTIAAFRMAGAELYNEAILITSVGSLPIRTSRIFPVGRKLGKSHQNVLVFCKGDPKRAAQACGPLGEVAMEYGGSYVNPQEA